MKDKLEKSGHKAGYYRARRFGIGMFACLAFGLAIGVPTYIMQKNHNKTLAQKEEPTEEPIENPDEEPVVDEDTYLSYGE